MQTIIEFMKLCEYRRSRSLPYIFQILYVLCFTRPRYQVSVYRTIGPLVAVCCGWPARRDSNEDPHHVFMVE